MSSFSINTPTRIITDKKISGEALRLFLFIAKAAKSKGYMWYTNAKIAYGDEETNLQGLGLAPNSIGRLLKSLEDNWYITRFLNVRANAKQYKDVKGDYWDGGIMNINADRVIWIRPDLLQVNDLCKRAGIDPEHESMKRVHELSIKRFKSDMRKKYAGKLHPMPTFGIFTDEQGREIDVYMNKDGYLTDINKQQLTDKQGSDFWEIFYERYVAASTKYAQGLFDEEF